MRSVFFIVILCFFSSVSCMENGEKILSRGKRYLTFPEGSSLSIAICVTSQTGITPGEIFTEGINWGISYELPNDTKNFKDVLGQPEEMAQRRHRRDLYEKMEKVMNSMGYEGRDCILRTLCEASRNLRPKGESLIDEILRIAFGYSHGRDAVPETGLRGNHAEYKKATVIGRNEAENDCHEVFPGCPFSLIDLALGHYSDFPFTEQRLFEM